MYVFQCEGQSRPVFRFEYRLFIIGKCRLFRSAYYFIENFLWNNCHWYDKWYLF